MKHAVSLSTRNPGSVIARQSSRPEGRRRDSSFYTHQLTDSMEVHHARVLACVSTLGILFGQCVAYTLLHTLCLQQEALSLVLVGALALLIWVLSILWLAHLEGAHLNAVLRAH